MAERPHREGKGTPSCAENPVKMLNALIPKTGPQGGGEARWVGVPQGSTEKAKRFKYPGWGAPPVGAERMTSSQSHTPSDSESRRERGKIILTAPKAEFLVSELNNRDSSPVNKLSQMHGLLPVSAVG